MNFKTHSIVCASGYPFHNGHRLPILHGHNEAEEIYLFIGFLLLLRLGNGISRWQKAAFFRHLLFFAFYRGQKAAEATQNICYVYREGVKGESTAQKWFAKFKNGYFHVDETYMPRSVRPSECDEKLLKALLNENDH
ncbi:hypothetical protein TNCV_3627621 [Trichonephila clavipes]|nr:hypothetical protein TNCV_3627621 [Trichonephila clavipes]